MPGLQPEGSSSNSNSVGGISESEMALKFSQSVQPVLRSNCAACHQSLQGPFFAVADSLAAFRTVQANNLMDLNQPQNSELVTKIQAGHNGIAVTVAADLQTQIQAYADSLIVAPPATALDTEAPGVLISSPAAASTLSGSVSLSAMATDNVGVVGVQFYLDGAPTGAEVLASPYSITLNTVAIANGAHLLSAKARDAAGNLGSTVAISVTINNVAPDLTAPTVAISAPTAGTTVSGAAVPVTASATDNVGVAGVQFYLDGALLGAEDVTAPYSVNWDTSKVVNGTHLLSAKARDAAGNMTTSANVSVTVNNVANPNATFTFISANILVPKCVACHSADNATSGYAFDTYLATLDSVVAGNPAASKLYIVTKPGGTMPKGGVPLTAVQLQAVFDWIADGAKNN